MLPAFRLPFRSRARIAADIDEELAFHLAAVAAQLRAAGWGAAEADAEARRRFGDLEHTKRYCRSEDLRREGEKSRMTYIDELRQDIRYAIRSLRASPAFTLIALATLAFGIGANTAIFSVVRGVLLAPLPFADADRIVRVWDTNRSAGIEEGSFSEPDFDDLRAQSRLAASVGGFFFADGQSGVDLTGDGSPERLSTALVAPGFFETLKPHPLVGRALTADEYGVGHNRVIVLAYALWQRRFGGDRGIVGKTIALNGDPFTVVGVMPSDFTYPATQSLDGWIPLSYFGPDAIGREREKHFISVIARLAPGVTPGQLQNETAGIAAQLASSYPGNRAWTSATVRTIRESIVGQLRRPLLVLVAAVAMVLLITCVNLAALLLARSSARERELSVRAAIGAGRSRIVRQLLTESLLLAAAGGVLGAALGYAAVRALVVTGYAQLPGAAGVRMDGAVLAFAIGVSLLAGLLFGVMPALRAAGPALEASLRAGARGSIGAGFAANRLRAALVVAEVALAVVLVAAASLATKSVTRLLAVDPWFDPSNVLVVRMSIPPSYEAAHKSYDYYQNVLDAIRGVPGVIAAGSIHDLPMRGDGEMVRPEQLGLPADGPSASSPVELQQVSAGYFRAMRVPLLAGRDLDVTDHAGTPIVLVVNQELVRRFFPGENVVGKVLHNGSQTVQIIGVVGNIRQRGLGEAVEPTIYIHALQNMRSGMSIVVRTSAKPLRLANAVRSAIWSLDGNQPITEITTLESVLGGTVARQKLLAWLLGIFGVLGLVLGALGIYGLLVFTVTQRRQEIGVRTALGAPASAVLRLIIGQGMILALAGVAIGVVVARLLTRHMQAELFQITAGDAGTFVEVIAVLLLTSLVASWWPARRALAIQPVTAMRYD